MMEQAPSDIRNFLAKIELEAALKDYADEKKANFLASRLIGPAFEVYMRLTDADKEDFAKIKEELLKEFERGQLNREEALNILKDRVRAPDESPHIFAYKLVELVKLAYPAFAETVRKTIAKDYFMKGLHPEMQIALKSRGTFSTDDISTLASESVRLTLAGVKSYSKVTNSSQECGHVEMSQCKSAKMINSIADEVVAKLKESSLLAVVDQACGSKVEQDENLNRIHTSSFRQQGRRYAGQQGKSTSYRGASGGKGGNQG